MGLLKKIKENGINFINTILGNTDIVYNIDDVAKSEGISKKELEELNRASKEITRNGKEFSKRVESGASGKLPKDGTVSKIRVTGTNGRFNEESEPTPRAQGGKGIDAK